MKHTEKKFLNFKSIILILVLIVVSGVIYHIKWIGVDVDSSHRMKSILSQSTGLSFDFASPDYLLSFPQDFSEHTSFEHERWVMTVNAIDHEGNDVGIQWTIVRVSSDDRESGGWLDPRLYIVKTVVTTKNKQWIDERIARGGIDQAGITQRPYKMWIDNWQWSGLDQRPFPAILTVKSDDFSLKFLIDSNYSPVPLGDNGYLIRHGTDLIASHEYIFPFVEVYGNLTLADKVYTISGNAIFKHGWASGFLDERQKGWDWFVINISKESKLVLTRDRYKNGDNYCYGGLFTTDGDYIPLTADDFTLQTLPERKLKNGRILPLQWIINVPKYGLNLTTQVVRSEQWLDTLIPYWQGPITTTGSHEVTGFMQLIGY